MTVTVKQGNYQVLQTGSVLVANNESTTITIDSEYSIIIRYIEDLEDKTQNISAKLEKHGVSIDLKNFNNPLGTTTNTPIPIATQGSQTIYLSLTVTAVGKAKILVYGLYVDVLGENNG